jgi:hypothetical protein
LENQSVDYSDVTWAERRVDKRVENSDSVKAEKLVVLLAMHSVGSKAVSTVGMSADTMA